MMDEFDTIETPENVDLQRRLAGIGSRFLAGLLDTVLIVTALLVLGLLALAFGVSFVTLGAAQAPGRRVGARSILRAALSHLLGLLCPL